MATVGFKDSSRIDWQATGANENGYPGHERLQLGCLMRIADATEAMAKRHTDLIDSLEWHKRRLKQEQDHNTSLQHSIRSLKGQITKLKKQLTASVKPH